MQVVVELCGARYSNAFFPSSQRAISAVNRNNSEERAQQTPGFYNIMQVEGGTPEIALEMITCRAQEAQRTPSKRGVQSAVANQGKWDGKQIANGSVYSCHAPQTFVIHATKMTKLDS